MTCVACRQASSVWLCRNCRSALRRVPDRLIDDVHVRSAFEHSGPARALVHRFKYEAVAGLAHRIASVLVPLIPPDTTAVVPIPSSAIRVWRLGVDPAPLLARAIADKTGLVSVEAFAAPRFRGRRARTPQMSRPDPTFVLRRRVDPTTAVLVDDVVTTGASIRRARALSGIRRAVTFTAAPVVTIGSRYSDPSRDEDP